MYLCAIFLVNGTHSVHGEPKLSTSANVTRLLDYDSNVVYLRMDTVRLETELVNLCERMPFAGLWQ